VNGEHEQDRDLGFGKAASRSRMRLINRDGSFNVRHTGLGYWSSAGLYHSLLSMGWATFFFVASLGYLGLNILFALVYFLIGLPARALVGEDPHSTWGAFQRSFFFSIETSSTIGYGHIVPATTLANVVVAIESFVGLISVAMITGLVFARFSRPHARVLFSDKALIAPYQNHGRALMFRMVNGRRNQLIEVGVQLTFSWIEDGRREFYYLDLERARVPFFSLNWTVVHPINAGSPLHGAGPKELQAREAEVTVLITGTDETFSQSVHARSSYRTDEIVCGARFLPMYYDDPDYGIVLEVGKLSDFEACELPRSS